MSTSNQAPIADTNKVGSGTRIGRPPSPDKRKKTMTIYLTVSEYKALKTRASEEQSSLSDLGRALLVE